MSYERSSIYSGSRQKNLWYEIFFGLFKEKAKILQYIQIVSVKFFIIWKVLWYFSISKWKSFDILN